MTGWLTPGCMTGRTGTPFCAGPGIMAPGDITGRASVLTGIAGVPDPAAGIAAPCIGGCAAGCICGVKAARCAKMFCMGIMAV